MKILLFGCLLLSTCSLYADYSEPYAELDQKKLSKLKPFIPEDWKAIALAEGDLNSDQLTDYALVIQNTDPQYIHQSEGLIVETVDANPRHLLLLFARQDKKKPGTQNPLDGQDGDTPASPAVADGEEEDAPASPEVADGEEEDTPASPEVADGEEEDTSASPEVAGAQTEDASDTQGEETITLVRKRIYRSFIPSPDPEFTGMADPFSYLGIDEEGVLEVKLEASGMENSWERDDYIYRFRYQADKDVFALINFEHINVHRASGMFKSIHVDLHKGTLEKAAGSMSSPRHRKDNTEFSTDKLWTPCNIKNPLQFSL